MKLHQQLVSNTEEREEIKITTNENYITIDGDGWTMTFTQQGLVTQVLIHANDEDTVINLKTPTNREVRDKVKENGRTNLNDFERAILDFHVSNV